MAGVGFAFGIAGLAFSLIVIDGFKENIKVELL